MNLFEFHLLHSSRLLCSTTQRHSTPATQLPVAKSRSCCNYLGVVAVALASRCLPSTLYLCPALHTHFAQPWIQQSLEPNPESPSQRHTIPIIYFTVILRHDLILRLKRLAKTGTNGRRFLARIEFP